MRTNKKDVQVEVVTYTCEVCGKTSNYKDAIEQCELRHVCKCENFSITIDTDHFSPRLELTCRTCGKSAHREIDSGHEKMLAEIWLVIGKWEQHDKDAEAMTKMFAECFEEGYGKAARALWPGVDE